MNKSNYQSILEKRHRVLDEKIQKHSETRHATNNIKLREMKKLKLKFKDQIYSL